MPDFYGRHCEKYIESYKKHEPYFRADERRIKALKLFGKVSTIMVYVIYVGMLVYLLLCLDARIVRAVFVPALIFFITTAIRSGINAPRPYEREGFSSLIPKKTRGRSCPSRHSACAFAIAFACLYISLPLGIFMLLISAMIGVHRMIIGVHFPLDVVFGAGLAALIAIPGFFIL